MWVWKGNLKSRPLWWSRSGNLFHHSEFFDHYKTFRGYLTWKKGLDDRRGTADMPSVYILSRESTWAAGKINDTMNRAWDEEVNGPLRVGNFAAVSMGWHQGSVVQVLDVSYNFLGPTAMVSLSSLPSLCKLNIDYNNIEIILDEVGEYDAFPCLKRLYAAGNGFFSESLVPLSKVVGCYITFITFFISLTCQCQKIWGDL